MKIAKIIVAIIFFLGKAYAWDMLDALNVRNNTTKPQAHISATAGYVAGGGISARTRHSSFNPASISLPSVRAGCGGIDFFAGSMSLLTKDELVNLAKNIGSSSVSYGFHVALKTYAPQMEAVTRDLRDLATKVNQSNIDSCKIVQAGYARLMPNDAMRTTACEEYNMSDGGMDYFAAGRKCRERGALKSSSRVLEGKKKDIPKEQNIIFEAGKKMKLDERDIEVIMSLTGTIVLKEDENGTLNPKFYLPLIQAQDFNYDSKKITNQYKCSGQASNNGPNKCLEMGQIQFPQNSQLAFWGLKTKIADILKRLAESMRYNKDAPVKDIEFLESIYEMAPIHDWLFIVAFGAIDSVKLESIIPEYVFLKNIERTLNEALQMLKANSIENLSIKEQFKILEKQINTLRQLANSEADKLEATINQTTENFTKALRKTIGGTST